MQGNRNGMHEGTAARATQAPGGTSLAIPVVAATNIHDGLQHISSRSLEREGGTSIRKLIQSADVAAAGRVLDGRQPRRRQRWVPSQQQAGRTKAGSPARCSSCPGLRLAIGSQSWRRLHGKAPCRWRRGGGGRRQVRPPPLHRPLRLRHAPPSGDPDACAGGRLDHRGDRWGQQQGPKGLCGGGCAGRLHTARITASKPPTDAMWARSLGKNGRPHATVLRPFLRSRKCVRRVFPAFVEAPKPSFRQSCAGTGAWGQGFRFGPTARHALSCSLFSP